MARSLHDLRERPRVVILGGGPAGLGAAFWLAERGLHPVLLEAKGEVGGHAGSFEMGGVRVDYGSHRLHPATDPEILRLLSDLLGSDLQKRPRHGRIRLGNRWVHFPLRPLDMIRSGPPSFLMGVARDSLKKLFSAGTSRPTGGRKVPGGEPFDEEVSFASVLREGLGPTICREFYFPYARKIWGLEPEEISPVQAARRVGSNSLFGLVRRLLPRLAKAPSSTEKGVFFYPRNGFGQISESLAQAARERGADIRLHSPVREVHLQEGGGGTIRVGGQGGDSILAWDHLWSTIPMGTLIGMIQPGPPADVLTAAGALESRAMVLLYLALETQRFSEFDAHYFPSEEIPFTRISEPKNYSGRKDPADRTVLCVEIPCSMGDSVWSDSDQRLEERVTEGLARAGIPVNAPILQTLTRRIPSAYPRYRIGFENHFDRVDEWLEGLPGLLTFGRQGLFAHDNTHHALVMALAATRCLDEEGRFEEERWSGYREAFTRHVVQD